MLASLDVGAIPAEKEARFKELIISNRLKRNFLKWGSRIANLLRPLGQMISGFFRWVHERLINLRETYKKEPILSDFDPIQAVNKLFFEAEELIKKEELEQAEKKLISIIGIDNKNIKAFKLLAGLYVAKKSYEEARQTYEYILKFKEDDQDAYGQFLKAAEKGDMKPVNISGQRSQIYFDLGLIFKAMDNIEDSIVNIKKALEIEPNNPRYLDTMVEISIIKKDKKSAKSAYDKLTEVNPENQKLAGLKKQIDEL